MQHLAMVMDGNRRWAKENKLGAVSLGHRKGVDAIGVAMRFCLSLKIPYLSLYAFSLENFKRSESEKSYLFNLFAEVIPRNIHDFIKNGIKVRFVGDRNFFPKELCSVICEAEEKTKHLTNLQVNFLFCYGSKQEVVSAVQSIARKVKSGELEIDAINETVLRNEMWLNDTPDPDLIIRTGNVSRLSNFLLFQAAYSELMFLDCYWPEIDERRLRVCVDKFYEIKKNFGE